MSEPYYATAVEASLAKKRRSALRIIAVVVVIIVVAVYGYSALF